MDVRKLAEIILGPGSILLNLLRAVAAVLLGALLEGPPPL